MKLVCLGVRWARPRWFERLILNLGISIPVSMANLGVYEAVLAFGLHQSGVPLAAAVAIATLHHGLELLGTNLGAAGLSLWVVRGRPGGW